MKVSLNGIELENIVHLKYLSVTLDRTFSSKQNIQETKMKVATHNNPLKKLANSKWGTNASTIGTTALVMCCSIVECAAPVWAISPHVDILDQDIKKACYGIRGCLKPTYVHDLYWYLVDLGQLNGLLCHIKCPSCETATLSFSRGESRYGFCYIGMM